jgi:hypothetical protein
MSTAAVVTKSVDTGIPTELDGGMNPRQCVLMVELVGDPVDAERRIRAALPDAEVFGEVDPVEAALLVMKRRETSLSCFVRWAAAA